MRALALGFAFLLIAADVPIGDDFGDLAPLLERARSVQETDIAAWRRFRFERRERKERLDASGRAIETEDSEAVVTPLAGGGFDERLVRRDGREPTPREIRRYRGEGRFGKHYARLRTGGAGAGPEPAGSVYSLGDLLHMSSYRYAGREVLDGVPCHRVEFSPGPLEKRRGLVERIGEALQGSVWISESGHHLFRAKARSVEPVSVFPLFVSLRELEIRFESEPVAGEAWLPRRIVVRSTIKILWKTVHRRTTYSYSGFVPVADSRECSSFSPLPARGTVTPPQECADPSG